MLFESDICPKIKQRFLVPIFTGWNIVEQETHSAPFFFTMSNNLFYFMSRAGEQIRPLGHAHKA